MREEEERKTGRVKEKQEDEGTRKERKEREEN